MLKEAAAALARARPLPFLTPPCLALIRLGFPTQVIGIHSSVPWLELLAFTGYAFVPVCATILMGQAAGLTGYYVAWGYGSLCMAVFLVRTMKRVVFQVRPLLV